MDIKQALKESIKKDACITRPKYEKVLKMKASKKYIDIFYMQDKKFKRWCPSIEDLTASDWYVTN